MINAIKLSLYSKLTPAQRNDVRTLLAVMDCEKKAGILSCLTELIGANNEQTPQQAMNCLTELVAQLVLECELTAADVIESNLLHPLAQSILYFCQWSVDYLLPTDRIPVHILTDLYNLNTLTFSDNWVEVIETNLNRIATYSQNTNGNNVTTALFEAIINAVYDSVMPS